MEKKNSTFNEQAEAALAKQKQQTKDFCLKIIPTGLWAGATIVASAAAFNSGQSFPIVCGVIAAAGAIWTAIKVYKEYNKPNEAKK